MRWHDRLSFFRLDFVQPALKYVFNSLITIQPTLVTSYASFCKSVIPHPSGKRQYSITGTIGLLGVLFLQKYLSDKQFNLRGDEPGLLNKIIGIPLRHNLVMGGHVRRICSIVVRTSKPEVGSDQVILVIHLHGAF